MNIKNKIKELIKRKNNNLPQVILANDDKLKQRLTNSYIADNPIDKCLNLILSELGIKPDEQVMIKNLQEISKEEIGNGYYINCYKNGKYIFKLGFKYESTFSVFPKVIIIYPYTDIKEEYEIYCNSNKEKIKITLEKISYEQKYQDGTKYLREYSPGRAEYTISKGDNDLILCIDPPLNRNTQEDETINYIKPELNNENKLVNYLVELNFPITIDEVYKKVCEISLGENISDYSYIHLYATNKEKMTDTIEISSGKCINFQKTKNDKTVAINQYGYWEYQLNDKNSSDDLENSTVRFAINGGPDGFSYHVFAKTDGELDDYTETLAMYDISTARKEVENVKKLVKQMIPQSEKNQK